MSEYYIYPGVSQTNGYSWLKSAMKWAYGIDYIHAWIGFELDGIPLVYHSTGFGIHVKDYESFIAKRTIKHVWQVPLSKDRYYAFVRKAFKETGKKYGSTQLLGIALIKGIELLSLGKVRFDRYPTCMHPNRDAEQVCSESAGRMIVSYTDATWEGKDPDLYTPLDFYHTCEWLENHNLATKLCQLPPLFYAS